MMDDDPRKPSNDRDGGADASAQLLSALLDGELSGQERREVKHDLGLRLLADGLSNEEIGQRLYISPETVRTHVRKAMAKLDADTRTQAVATALRQSLIA